MEPEIRPAKRRHLRGDKLTHKGELVIFFKGTDKPYCTIKPGYNPEVGPYVAFYGHSVVHPEETSHLMTFGIGGATSIITRLPVVIAAARRIQARAESSRRQG